MGEKNKITEKPNENFNISFLFTFHSCQIKKEKITAIIIRASSPARISKEVWRYKKSPIVCQRNNNNQARGT